MVEEFRLILDAGVVPLAIGGDHSITLGELRAVAKRHGPVGLIDFDSNTDTWDNYWGERYTPWHLVQARDRGGSDRHAAGGAARDPRLAIWFG